MVFEVSLRVVRFYIQVTLPLKTIVLMLYYELYKIMLNYRTHINTIRYIAVIRKYLNIVAM